MELTKGQSDKARTWMKRHKGEYKEIGTNEHDCTRLAEDCCAELDLYDEDDNIPDELFNIAAQVVD